MAIRWSFIFPFMVLFLVGIDFGSSVTHAENWPMWRGPRQNGTTQETDLPVTWNRTENVHWRFPLPGVAPSTPVVWEDKIFLTTTVKDTESVLLLCLDVTGKQLWELPIGEGPSEQLEQQNLAAPSPCTDGRHVWAFSGNGTVSCQDLSGKQIWQFHVEDRYEKVNMPWGMASSPVFGDELLYMQIFHLDSSRVVALDKLTGREFWTSDRETDARGKCMRSYATPAIYRDAEREYLLSHGQDYIVAHDLQDGKELWRCGNFHLASGYNPSMHMSSSPVVAEGHIVVPSSSPGNFQVVRGDGAGDISDDPHYRLWSKPISPTIPSALVVDSLVYICSDAGVLLCLDLATGEEVYRRAVHRHKHQASPVYGDGKIYLTARDGTVAVVQSGREFKILATNSLDEFIAASPAISGRRIYLRTFDALYSIGAVQTD